jgi:hypothetical protein
LAKQFHAQRLFCDIRSIRTQENIGVHSEAPLLVEHFPVELAVDRARRRSDDVLRPVRFCRFQRAICCRSISTGFRPNRTLRFVVVRSVPYRSSSLSIASYIAAIWNWGGQIVPDQRVLIRDAAI